MKQQSETINFVCTVLLTNGREISHTYDVPSNEERAKEFIGEMVDMLHDGLQERNPPILLLKHPDILYNIDNVMSVRWNFIDSKELNERMAELAKKKIGFLKH